MGCLGGTVEDPRPWYRYRTGSTTRVEGRICNRDNPRTSRRKCAACPAFRGLRWDGTVANGLGTDETDPVGLTPDEHQRYQAALEAQLIDDDDEPLWLWYARQDRELVTRTDGTHQVIPGLGERSLRKIGDPDATDRWATRMREWRAAHPGYDKRQRKRKRAAYMRAYRAERKEAVGA